MIGPLVKAGPARSGRQQPRHGATRKGRQAPARRRALVQLWVNRLLVLVALVTVIAASAWGVIELRQLPVQRITVSGDLEHVSRETLEQLVQPSLAGGFLGADLDQIRSQLQNLPWVYRASVRRRWPSTLEIRVVEQQPIARWGTQGFLNLEGEMFQSLNATEWQSLPLLVGPQGAERDVMADYRRLAQWLAPLGLLVTELALDERGELRARLDAGFALVLGDSQLLERIQRFAVVYPHELRQRSSELARVDLRYGNGMAVRFREPSRVAGVQ